MPYPPKICVLKEMKDIDVNVFYIITNKNEAKAMTERLSCDFKSKLIVQFIIQIRNRII